MPATNHVVRVEVTGPNGVLSCYGAQGILVSLEDRGQALARPVVDC
jgi:hypothetical protein